MADSDVTVDASELVARIRELRERGGDLSGTMRIVAEELVSAVNDEFETAGRGRWAPLSPRTIAQRRGSSAQILKDTGRFAASIFPDAGPDFAEAFTDVSYAVFHVSDQPRSRIPLRNPFDLPEEVFERATETILRGLLEGLTS